MKAGLPYAEVIGDPVEHSKSPLIHRYWLDRLGLEGEYVRSRVAAGEIGNFLKERRSDPDWRGCNVTIPHKERIAAQADLIDAEARAIGAVNCVVPRGGRLHGFNTDLDGIAAVLDAVDLGGRTAVMIGAGGASRAAAAYLARRRVETLILLVRDPARAAGLAPLMPATRVEVVPLADPRKLAATPALVVNASPLGMTGQPALPGAVLDLLSDVASGALFFDMVYEPLETGFLSAGRAGGAGIADGLTMLIGQAAHSFELFFGQAPPLADSALRDLLVTSAA